MDKDNCPVLREDDVGFAGKRLVFRAVDREAVAEAVQHRAQGEFRLGVAPADAGHDLGAFFRSEDVDAGIRCGKSESWNPESSARKAIP